MYYPIDCLTSIFDYPVRKHSYFDDEYLSFPFSSVRYNPIRKRPTYKRNCLNNVLDQVLDNVFHDGNEFIFLDTKLPKYLNGSKKKCLGKIKAKEDDDKKVCELEEKKEDDSLEKVENEKSLVSNDKSISALTEYKFRCNNYDPKDIEIKVTNNQLTIKGKKENKSDGSFFLQQFERTITIPENTDKDKISCSIDSDGYLKLNLPKLKKEEPISIPITMENKKEESSEKEKTEEPVVEDLIEE